MSTLEKPDELPIGPSHGASAGRYVVQSATLFLLPFIATYLLDLFVLERAPVHHLGDYSGLFSLGLGWLHDLPFIYFPWPLWGVGQISALFIRAIEPPLSSLNSFYVAWAIFNVLVGVAAAVLTAFALRAMRLPLLTALALGLMAATMPAVSVGWLNSNPYFPFGVLLVPGSLVLLARLTDSSATHLAIHEYISLGLLGWIVANNFAAMIVVIAAFLTVALLHPRQALSGKVPHGQNRWMREALAFGLAVAVSSLAGIVILRLGDRWQVMLSIFACVLVISWFPIRLVRHRLAEFLVRPSLALMLGWMAGANILIFAYGAAARIATGTASAPGAVSASALLPRINWSELTHGTYWFWFVPICYVGTIVALLAAFAARGRDRSLLFGSALFALSVLSLVALSTDANRFPVGFSPIGFGRDGRYLWLGIATTTALAAALLSYWRGPIIRHLVLAPIIALGLLSLYQSHSAKRYIVEAINETNRATDEAIDMHLAMSPRNLVLVANAYFPPRAQVLYAYNNSILESGLGESAAIHSSRVKYIGRFGGAHWVPPERVMANEGLSTDNILIIGEGANYPASVEIIRRFENTDTVIARQSAGAN